MLKNGLHRAAESRQIGPKLLSLHTIETSRSVHVHLDHQVTPVGLQLSLIHGRPTSSMLKAETGCDGFNRSTGSMTIVVIISGFLMGNLMSATFPGSN